MDIYALALLCGKNVLPDRLHNHYIRFMKRYVAFLRGINVSGKNMIKMDALKEMFGAMGFDKVATYIQSGNVVFDTAEKDTEALRHKIEKHLHQSLGYEVPTIVRSQAEIADVIKASPFDQDAEKDRKLYITFLAGKPDADKAAALEALSTEKEVMQVLDREVYFLTPAYGETKFSNAFMEKKLGVPATTRNWATVNKVMEI